MESPYNPVAGLDVHKKSVVVVVLQKAQPEQDYASGTFGTTQFELKKLAAFLRQHGVTQVAMESTAPYWRPVWMNLEDALTPTLAQARSIRARRQAR
jgi:transposase